MKKTKTKKKVTPKKTNKPLPKEEKKRFGIEVVGADWDTFESFADSVGNPWRVFFLGLLRGAGFGFGALVGGAIILTIISYIFTALYHFPFIGELLRNFSDSVTSNMK